MHSLLFFALMAHAQALPFPSVQTTLTPFGDREAATMYSTFEANTSGCQPLNEGPRVILTGFGLFSGLPNNISGTVLDNLANEEFWPNNWEPDALPKTSADLLLSDGILHPAEKGARIYNREFRLQGVQVSACLIIADVLWDFAGAVFARELERFQPQVVIMSGVGSPGSAELEAGAINEAVSMPGFKDDGKQDGENDPTENHILPGQGSTLYMTWDNAHLGELVRPFLDKLGYGLSVPQTAVQSNDYICNNVSYIVLAAAAGRKLELAGGNLLLQPKITSQPKIGFFHYPREARREQALQWAQILLTMAAANL